MKHPYTQLENETLETLARAPLSARELRIMLAVLRLTNGYHLNENTVKIAYLQQLTGMARNHLQSTLKRLHQRQVISYKEDGLIACHGPALWQLTDSPDLGLATKTKNKSRLGTSSDSPRLASSDSPDLGLAQIVPDPDTNPDTLKKTRKKTLKKTRKKTLGEFSNVLLTDEEYQKLQDKFGAGLTDKIEALSIGIESKGYKYKSHYATILNWERMKAEPKGEPNGKPKQQRAKGPLKYIRGVEQAGPEDTENMP